MRKTKWVVCCGRKLRRNWRENLIFGLFHLNFSIQVFSFMGKSANSTLWPQTLGGWKVQNYLISFSRFFEAKVLGCLLNYTLKHVSTARQKKPIIFTFFHLTFPRHLTKLSSKFHHTTFRSKRYHYHTVVVSILFFLFL